MEKEQKRYPYCKCPKCGEIIAEGRLPDISEHINHKCKKVSEKVKL